MSETVELTGEIRRETELAVLFFDGDREVWLPKSQIVVTAGTDGVSVEVPLWLAEEKELV